MCQCFSKIEDLCSQAMKQAAKEVFENKMHYHGTMKTVARAYLNNRECSVYFLSELKLRRIFPAVDFVNTNQVYFKYTSSILQVYFKYTSSIVQVYFLKKNLANYQMVAQIFLRDWSLCGKTKLYSDFLI